jgi:ABC-2 type transport system ATP-binding protein
MIEVQSLRKVFGPKVAVNGISFSVKKGEILGFLGPNAAGKTTTMRMITGFLPPTSGTARIGGYDILEDPLKAKKLIGYMPELPPLYKEMVVRSYLSFVSDIKKIPKSKRRKRVGEMIEITGLGDVAGRIIGHLSKGYRQRVGLAQALLHDPEVIILDEPTAGLDPRQIIEIRNLIKELGKERTIIISTHILPEVSMTCQKVIIINEGNLVAENSIEGLFKTLKGSESLIVRITRKEEQFQESLKNLEGIISIRKESEGTFHVDVDKSVNMEETIAQKVIQEGFGLKELRRIPPSLEDVFIKLVTEEKGVDA